MSNYGRTMEKLYGKSGSGGSTYKASGKSAGSMASGSSKGYGVSFSGRKLNKAGRSSKHGDNYYRRDSLQFGSSSYYTGSSHLKRSVDPHDNSERNFDLEERKQYLSHDRELSEFARRADLEKNHLKHNILRHESQGREIDGKFMQGVVHHEHTDNIAWNSALGLTDHEKEMQKQRSAEANQRALLSISEGSRTHRSWLANLFHHKSERMRHKANARAGELALARDKQRYKYMKKAAKLERRRIVVQRGYY